MDPFSLKLILITLLIFIPAERFLSLRPQKIFRRDAGNDLVFLFLNGALTKMVVVAMLLASISAAEFLIPASFRSSVGGLPFWVQLPLAILIGDTIVYWTHRAFHVVPWLWKFHAIHHSSEELDWLAAFRVHPVDQIATRGLSLIPVMTLGFSEWAIVTYATLFYWQAVLNHANVRIKFGPLRWLLSSPEFHHWHHSNEIEARDKNFAAQLSILDVVFRTMYLPSGAPSSYGLDEPMQQRYFRQIVRPFRKER